MIVTKTSRHVRMVRPIMYVAAWKTQPVEKV